MAARGAALRARSAPPSRGWSSLVGPEVAEDQAEMQSYVSTLLPSIGMVPHVTGADSEPGQVRAALGIRTSANGLACMLWQEGFARMASTAPTVTSFTGRFRNWTSGAAARWSRCPDSNSLP